MEPVLIATDVSHVDICAIKSFRLDMTCGYDKMEFEAEFEPVAGVGGGSLLYMDGTEYGGVVDEMTVSTSGTTVLYSGRTWTGILAAKIIMPPDGNAYRTVSGEANSVLSSLVTLLDLSDDFSASAADSGITITNFTFARFTDAYSGITKMLSDNGAKLKMRRASGKFVLWAEARKTITDEVDSDIMEFGMTKTHRTVNHLVCAGVGEGTDRVIENLYADADGEVSTTQSLFGIDEIADYYDYNNADSEELLSEGTKKLKEMQTKGAVDVSQIGKGEWDVGDILVARDNKSGETVSAPVTGKLVKVGRDTNWTLQIEYQVGETSRGGAKYSATSESSGGGGGTSHLVAGIIYPFSGASVPDGFLLCDGSAVSRSTYPELFSVIGTVYGAGDGSTTFNLPDLRGRTPIGSSTTHLLGSTGGEESHTLTVNEMPSHMHEEYYTWSGAGSVGGNWKTNMSNTANGGAGTWTHSSGLTDVSYTGGGGSHNNMQPFAAINYIISTGQGSGVSVDEIIAGMTTLPLTVANGGTGATTLAGAPFVQKAGDTMSGYLVMADNKNIITQRNDYTDSTVPSGSMWMDSVVGWDSNGTYSRFNLRQVAHANKTQGVQLEAHRQVSGTNYYNGIQMLIGDTGAMSVDINQPAAWRVGMGAMSAILANNYYGMGRPDGNTTDHIRTSEYGLIPYASGGKSSTLGTESWPFKCVYAYAYNSSWYNARTNKEYNAFYAIKEAASGFCPAYSLGTKGGGVWTMANYSDENLLFAYIPSNSTSSNNASKTWYLRQDAATGYIRTTNTVLYNNTSGTNGTVALSASAANYNHMRIFFRGNDSQYDSADFYSPNGKVGALVVHEGTTNTSLNQKRKAINISGTSITVRNNSEIDNSGSPVNANNVWIVRVEAWNE